MQGTFLNVLDKFLNTKRVLGVGPARPVESPLVINPAEEIRLKQLTELKSSINQASLLQNAAEYPIFQLRQLNTQVADFKSHLEDKLGDNANQKSESLSVNDLKLLVTQLLDISKTYQSFQKHFSAKAYIADEGSSAITDLWGKATPHQLSYEALANHENKLIFADLHKQICAHHGVDESSKMSLALDRSFQALSRFQIKETEENYEADLSSQQKDKVSISLMQDYLKLLSEGKTLNAFDDFLDREARNIHLEEQYYNLSKRAKLLEYKGSLLEKASLEKGLNIPVIENSLLDKFRDLLCSSDQSESTAFKRALNIINTLPLDDILGSLKGAVDSELQLTRLGRLSAVITADQNLRPLGFVRGLYFPEENLNPQDSPFPIENFDPEKHYLPNAKDEYLRVYEQALREISPQLPVISKNSYSSVATIQVNESDRRKAYAQDEFLAKGFIAEFRASLALDLVKDSLKDKIEILNVINSSFSGVLDILKIDSLLLVRSSEAQEIFLIPLQFKSSICGVNQHLKANANIPVLVPSGKTISELKNNLEGIIEESLENGTAIKLGYKQAREIINHSKDNNVFSELEIIKTLAVSSLTDNLIPAKARTEQTVNNYLHKTPSTEQESNSLVDKFLNQEKLSLTFADQKLLKERMQKENLSEPFMRLTVYRLARLVNEGEAFSEKSLDSIVNGVKDEKALLISSTEKYLRAMDDTITSVFKSQFKTAFQNYVSNLSEDTGKRKLSSLSQIAQEPNQPFYGKLAELIKDQNINFSQFDEILPKVLTRTFSHLELKRYKVETLEPILFTTLAKEIRGAAKEINFYTNIQESLEDFSRNSLSNSQRLIPVSIFSEDTLTVLEAALKQDKDIHKIIKAYDPHSESEFSTLLKESLFQQLSLDIFDQTLSAIDESLTKLLNSQLKKNAKLQSKLNNSSEALIDSALEAERYLRLTNVISKYFETSFGKQIYNFLEDLPSTVINDKYANISSLCEKFTRLESSEEEISGFLSKDLAKWSLQADNNVLANIFVESIKNILGENKL